MAKKEKKTTVGAMIARLIVIILITAIGTVGSFFGVKAFFVNRLKKEKDDEKAKIAQQLKEENESKIDVTMTQLRDSVVIRVFHHKNKQIVFVPLRRDMELSLNSKGKKAVGKDTATIAEFVEASTSVKLLKQQVQRTLGVNIADSEQISEENFEVMMDTLGGATVSLENSITYSDVDGTTNTLPAGTNKLTARQMLLLLAGDDIFTSEATHAEVSGDIYVAICKALKEESLDDFKEFVESYYEKTSSNIDYSDISDFVDDIHDIKSDDFNYIMLDGKDDGKTFTLDKKKAKTVLEELTSKEGKVDGAVTTTTSDEKESTTATASEDTKKVSIELQNSTSIAGLAGSWRDKLTAAGYTVGSVLTNREGELTHTKIIVNKKGLGEDLKSYFKDPEYSVGTNSSGAEISIILGTEDEL